MPGNKKCRIHPFSGLIPHSYQFSAFREQIFYKAAITSSREGIEGEAPFLVTVIEDAFALIFRISGIGIFSKMPEIKYPVKVSPAAVVSTAFTGKIG